MSASAPWRAYRACAPPPGHRARHSGPTVSTAVSHGASASRPRQPAFTNLLSLLSRLWYARCYDSQGHVLSLLKKLVRPLPFFHSVLIIITTIIIITIIIIIIVIVVIVIIIILLTQR
eukprot:COSAG01_NODE_836_length_13206_cov_139.627375_8_plen_118_part_00